MGKYDDRYADTGTQRFVRRDGVEILYLGRRLIRPSYPVEQQAAFDQTDRLDLLAARYLGRSERFWLLCDANDALDPFDLERPGRRLDIPEV
ncbi:MAG: LysM domain-containing protein [Acidobacteriota bacterium]